MLKIDDGFLSHHKAEKIPYRVLGFWLHGLLYAARNLTDGKLPKSFVRNKIQTALCDDLLARGLWKKTESGFLIHDYLQWNESKKEVEERREKARQRQVEWRQRNVVTNTLVTNKDRYGKEREGVLPHKPTSEYIYPAPVVASPALELTEEQRAENLRRVRDLTTAVASQKAMAP